MLCSSTQLVFRVWRIIKSNLLEGETSVWTENLISVYFKLTAVVTLALLIMFHINKLYIQTAVTLVSVVNFISCFTVGVEVFIVIHCTVRKCFWIASAFKQNVNCKVVLKSPSDLIASVVSCILRYN